MLRLNCAAIGLGISHLATLFFSECVVRNLFHNIINRIQNQGHFFPYCYYCKRVIKLIWFHFIDSRSSKFLSRPQVYGQAHEGWEDSWTIGERERLLWRSKVIAGYKSFLAMPASCKKKFKSFQNSSTKRAMISRSIKLKFEATFKTCQTSFLITLPAGTSEHPNSTMPNGPIVTTTNGNCSYGYELLYRTAAGRKTKKI